MGCLLRGRNDMEIQVAGFVRLVLLWDLGLIMGKYISIARIL